MRIQEEVLEYILFIESYIIASTLFRRSLLALTREVNLATESSAPSVSYHGSIWYGLTMHGMVYGIAWRAWHGISYGLVGMAWHMVWPGGHYMV